MEAKMLLVLILAFLVTPLVEIAVFIKIGGLIGAPATVAIVLFNAVVGAALLRAQGTSTLLRARACMERGEPPVNEVLDGLGLLIAGTLLVTPGLVTDALGFTLLIPPVRRAIIRELFRQIAQSGTIHVQLYRSSDAPGPEEPGAPKRHPAGTIIDAEYEVMNEGPDKPSNRA
jgi:UPF0716 protein FxsA